VAVTLGKRGDYAIRAMLDLARHWDGEPRKAREIAASMDIPPGFLKQVLASLVSQGLLRSSAGPRGGYRLARPPEEITLLDIIEPLEQYRSPNKCILRGGPCDWSGACPVHDAWSLAQSAFAESLDGASLAQLSRIDYDIEQGTHIADPRHDKPTTRRGIRT
jgi:Rrf2 family protein